MGFKEFFFVSKFFSLFYTKWHVPITRENWTTLTEVVHLCVKRKKSRQNDDSKS